MRKLIAFLFLLIYLSPTAKAATAPPEITPVTGQIDPYKTRSELLMDATDYTGVFTPEQAAVIWAQGLEKRSAAMQYTVMTEGLKQKYAKQLDALDSNWVTGVSSPAVVAYTLTEVTKPDNLHAKISLSVEVSAILSPPEFYKAKLWIIPEKGFWRIDRIWTDSELYAYTFYRP